MLYEDTSIRGSQLPSSQKVELIWLGRGDGRTARVPRTFFEVFFLPLHPHHNSVMNGLPPLSSLNGDSRVPSLGNVALFSSLAIFPNLIDHSSPHVSPQS
jgi:hypothetical protein